jgi:hypothetical protein
MEAKMIAERTLLAQYKKEDDAILSALKELIFSEGELIGTERATFIKKYCAKVDIRDLQFILMMSKDDLVHSLAKNTYFLLYRKKTPYPLMSSWSKIAAWHILRSVSWAFIKKVYVQKIGNKISSKKQRLKEPAKEK